MIDLRAEQSAGQTINELKGTHRKGALQITFNRNLHDISDTFILEIVTMKVISNIQGTNFFFQED